MHMELVELEGKCEHHDEIADDELSYSLGNGVTLLPEKRYITNQEGIVFPLTENNYRFLMLLIKGETDKQNIINQVWHEQAGAVSDSSYYGQIYMLRKAFDMLGLSGTLIKTIPRKGVKYMGKVSFKNPSPAATRREPEQAEAPPAPLPASSSSVNVAGEINAASQPAKGKSVEWYNSWRWNTLITTLAVLAVCWLTTLLAAGVYFFFH